MTYTASRQKIFLTGLVITVFIVLSNRLWHIAVDGFAVGEVTETVTWVTKGSVMNSAHSSAPIVKFSTGMYEIRFQGPTNMHVQTGDHVTVIYDKNDPTEAGIYSFTGFWMIFLFYSILPVVVFSAATYSFLTKNDLLVIVLDKDFSIRKTKKPLQNQ